MLQIVLLAGKFVFLIILYLFIYRVIRSTNRELRAAVPATDKRQGFASADTFVPPDRPRVLDAASAGVASGVWKLVVQKSPSLPAGQAYALPAGSHALAGRAPEMDIYLEDTFVSSKHALFEATTAGLQVEDLRSTNGTQVNGVDISDARVLRPGDRVEVGDTVFRVEVA
jgi:hypothetical protein